MLNLSNLRRLLSQVLSLPALHTAALFTPEGHLVSYASDPGRSKDEIRVVVGISSEVWRETKDQDMAMLESELGKLLVLPVEQAHKESNGNDGGSEPVLLLAVNAEESVSWKEIEHRARRLVQYLETPIKDVRTKLATAPSSPISSPQRPNR